MKGKYVLETLSWRVLTYSFQKTAMKPQATNNTYGLGSKFSYNFGGNSDI